MPDAAIRKRIVQSRVNLMFSNPFFGNLVTRFKLIEDNKRYKTAATNGRDFFYNTEFIGRLNDDELTFLFGHEVLHAVLDHIGRLGDRNAKLWFIACDYVVNSMLIEQRIGTMPNTGLYDAKYTGMSSDAVYDLIKNDSAEQDQQILDEHICIAGGDAINEAISDSMPTITSEELAQIADELKAVVIDLVSDLKISGNAGCIPGEIARIVGDLTDPKMDWRDILTAQLSSTNKDDYSWMRPSRRAWHMDAILPGRNFAESALNVAIAIDTSGSISNEMVRDFLGEVKGIMQSYDNFRITLWTFDTKVYNAVEFTEIDIDEIDTYDVQGGGGTDFSPNWDYMKERDLTPDQFVMFTDGQPWDSWGDPDYCETVFVIHGNDNIEAPFGMTAHYEKS